EGRAYRLRGKDGTNDPKIESENTYRQYLDKNSGPLPRDWFFLPILNQAANERLFDTQKPEKLIQKFILASSNENDLILDFFGGSGTTAAVAHKLKRRYLTIEQMTSQVELIIPRLNNVIQGDNSGISKEVNWQGGGSFVYCELAELASKYSDRVEQAESSGELITIWDELKESSNLSYKVDPKQFDKSISLFKDLSFEDQQRFLIEAIDKNQIYVNYSDIDDESNTISEQDKKLNQQFYGA
ncbi:site-specific DNA-methyltransferase, partial [Vibrio splendidus]|uniref:site-specific DNA-methyltransferase n=1 Tax=Vibrio splendidus TaxID=29497 RepID=UPI0024687612